MHKQTRWSAVTILANVAQHIKLCPSGAQTYARPFFCHRDFNIDPMTLSLDRDIDILKTYHLHTENEAASLGQGVQKL